MNSKCETPQQQPKAHARWDGNLCFEMANGASSDALKLQRGSYAEINRGPKLCTEYISHQSKFRINSTFDKEPTGFPCG